MSSSEQDAAIQHARLLAVLDPDPDRAQERYALLREDLKRFFEYRGCQTAEDEAHTVLRRGMQRISDGAEVFAADPRGYFFGIARHVLQEDWKRNREEHLEPEDWSTHASTSREFQQVEARLTLQKCLGALDREERMLIVKYHTGDRENLSRELGLTMEGLRTRVHRIRRKIEKNLAPTRFG